MKGMKEWKNIALLRFVLFNEKWSTLSFHYDSLLKLFSSVSVYSKLFSRFCGSVCKFSLDDHSTVKTDNGLLIKRRKKTSSNKSKLKALYNCKWVHAKMNDKKVFSPFFEASL